MASDSKGLYRKYYISRVDKDGEVDYPCFVLRIDGKDPAAMAALLAYADHPGCGLPMRRDLHQKIRLAGYGHLLPDESTAAAEGEA